MAASLHKEYKAIFAAALNTPQRKALLSDVVAKENEFRKLFAQDVANPKIKDPYASLLPVHESADQALWHAWGEEEMPEAVIMPLDAEARADTGTSMVADNAEFLLNWRIFTEGSLQFLDWTNIFAAGGSVLACLAPVPPEHDTPASRREYFREKYPGSDIDLFIWGLDEQGAKLKMEQIYNCIIDACPFESTVFRTAHAVTIVSQYPYRHVQIVLRLYKSPAEILMGFDVDCCGVGFDGTQAWATRRAHIAIVSQANSVDMSRRSPSYEMRLAKYAVRGFEIHVPSIDRSRVDPQIFERSYNKVNGLARLLVLEALRDQQKRLSFKENQRRRKLRPPHENAGNYASLAYARSGDLRASEVDANDYQSVLLAWGPKWTAKRLRKLAHKKDFMLNNPYLMHKWRKSRHHQHPTFYGTMADIFEDCCGQCPPLPADWDPEEQNLYVSGPLTFISDNPGRQQIGSFNPITDEDWTEDAYIPPGLDSILQAITRDDHLAVGRIIDEQGFDVNKRDWTGRTLLQFATFCNAKKVVAELIGRGARISYTLPDGRTALHVAAQYGFLEIVEMILKKNKANVEEKEARENGTADADGAKKPASGEEPTTADDEDADEDEDDDAAGDDIAAEEEPPEAEYESVTHDDLSEDDDYEKVKKPSESTQDEEKTGEEDADEEKEDDIIDLSFVDWDFKMSPLHFACFHGHRDVVKVLLEHGATGKQVVKYKIGYRGEFLNEASYRGTNSSYTTYYLATLAAEPEAGLEVIRVLAEAKVPIPLDDTRNTLLHLLVNDEKDDLILTLLKEWHVLLKGSLNVLNTSYFSPVYLAATNGRVKVLNGLLKAGGQADPSLAACKDLIKHSQTKNINLWEINYKYKSDPKILQSTLPHTALAKAATAGQHQCVKLLVDAGADINRVIDTFTTILDSALKEVESLEKEVEEWKEGKKEAEVTWAQKVRQEKPDSLEAFLLGAAAVIKDDDSEEPLLEEEKAQLEAYFSTDDDNAPKPDAKLLEKDRTGRDKERQLRRLKRVVEILKEGGAKTFRELNPTVEVPEQPQWQQKRRNRYDYSNNNNDLGDETIVANLSIDRRLSADEGRAYFELFKAAWEGDCAKIRELCVDCGALKRLLVTVRCTLSEVTPLHVAAYRGHAEVVELLLRICGEQYRSPKKREESGDKAMNNYQLDAGSESEDDGTDDEDEDEDEEDNENDHQHEEGGEDSPAQPVWSGVSQEAYITRVGRLLHEYLRPKGADVEGKWKEGLVDAVRNVLDSSSIYSQNLSAFEIAVIKGHTEVVKCLLRVADDLTEAGVYPKSSTTIDVPPDVCVNGTVKCGLVTPSNGTGIDWVFALGSLKLVGLILSETLGGNTLKELFPDVEEEWKDWFHAQQQLRMPKSAEEVIVSQKVEAKQPVGKKAPRPYAGLKPKSFQPKEVAADEVEEDGNARRVKTVGTRSAALQRKRNKDNVPDTCYYRSFLDRAATYGRVDLLEYLLNGDTATTIVNEAMSRNPTDPRTTYLRSLSESRCALAVKEILGTAVPEGRKRNGNAMHRAAINNASGAIRALKQFLAEDVVKQMLEERLGDEAPVHIASASGFVESVEALVDVAGVEILELPGGKRGWTAMHYAAHHNRLTVLARLIELAPSEMTKRLLTTQSNRFRHTPLMIAAMRGYSRCVKLLKEALTHMPSPSPAPSVDFQGLNPLHMAVRGEHLETVKQLLMSETADEDYIASLLAKEDASGFTPLGTAIQMLHHHLRDGRTENLKNSDAVSVPKEEDQQGWGQGPLGERPLEVYRAVKGAMGGKEISREVVPLEVVVGATNVAIDVEADGAKERWGSMKELQGHGSGYGWSMLRN
ncbi:hypothetical protein HDV00_006507 [Rhizophlyctis rosea]|nr:hypothetical protein HDV00_006507 [Rhizophlyctis rosea]